MNIKIRKALKTELEWVNEKYDEVEFVHSNFENEIIAIAEIHENRVGLGRLVAIDTINLELGGIYVFDSHRGHGIARKLVHFLLTCANPRHTIYCIPFIKLTNFYQSFGFVSYEPTENVPESILKKFKWCEQYYDEKVELLVLPTREK